jgi:hypothetical protein
MNINLYRLTILDYIRRKKYFTKKRNFKTKIENKLHLKTEVYKYIRSMRNLFKKLKWKSIKLTYFCSGQHTDLYRVKYILTSGNSMQHR